MVKPYELPEEIEFENTLENLQKYVDGDIECVYIPDRDVVFVCNDEGKNIQMPFNRDIGYDIIAGPFLILGNDYINGEFISLNENQILRYKMRFDKDSIIETENKITAIRMNNYRSNDYER